MRWPVFVIALYVAAALEVGLANLLRIGSTTPSLLLILAVFVAMYTAPQTIAFAMIAIGVVHDIVHSPFPGAAVVGPAALGYLLAGYAVVQLRAVFFRDSAWALASLVFITGLLLHLTIVLLCTLRGIPWLTNEPIPGWDAPNELYYRFLHLIYTAAVAVPLGKLLIRTSPLWQFHGHKSRAY